MKERIERFSRYMEYKGLNDNQVTIQCGLGVGVIGGSKKGKSDLGQKTIEKILEKYQDLNRVWLLTGEGAMLNQTDNSPSVSGEGNIRYWEDVSATGGGLDFLENPDEHSIMRFSAPTFHDCTDAVNIYGDSMYPIYKNGEIIVLKEWRESFIDDGYCYLIITRNGNRMVKYLRRSEDESKVLCMSENPKYDPFEILKEDILRLYIVKGSLRKDTL